MTGLIKKMIWISAVLTLFLGANVLRALGYGIGEESTLFILKIFPSFSSALIAVILLVSVYKRRSILKRDIKFELTFLSFFIVLVLYTFVFKLSSSISVIPNTLLLPILLSICLRDETLVNLGRMRSLIITFYIINCLIAIIERTLSFHFFPSTIERLDNIGFRSTALQNHPLNNALITVTVMAFIITKSNLKIFSKYALFFLGLASVVCYGSRSALLVSCLLIIIFIFGQLFSTSFASNKVKLQRLVGYILIVGGICFTYFLITQTAFGERLMKKAYFDNSANVRLQVLEMFSELKTSNLLIGSNQNATDKLKEQMGISTIENPWLVYILRFGLVFSMVLFIFLWRFFMRIMANYPTMIKYQIVFTFLALTTTFISIGSNTAAISIFVLCAYAFKPFQKPQISHAIRFKQKMAL